MKLGKIARLSDMLVEPKNRPVTCVYFIRLSRYSLEINEFIQKSVERAKKKGILIDGKLVSPDAQQISYYQSVMGDSFSLNISFLEKTLSKWMKGVGSETIKDLAFVIYRMLCDLKTSKNNDSIVKNAFIKYMCWLYYKFQVIVKNVKDDSPLIICDGDVSIYELQMFYIMHFIGCDVILLQLHGDDNYVKVDPTSLYSESFEVSNAQEYPRDYSIKYVINQMNQAMRNQGVERISASTVNRSLSSSSSKPVNLRNDNRTIAQNHVVHRDVQNSQFQGTATDPEVSGRTGHNAGTSNSERMRLADKCSSGLGGIRPKRAPIDYGPEPQLALCTNEWFSHENPLDDILTPFVYRCAENDKLCNSFVLLSGVEDILTFENSLNVFYQKMQDQNRNIVIVEHEILPPGPEEISKISRGNYRCVEDMIRSMSSNLFLGVNTELRKYLYRAFGTVLLETAKESNENVNRLTSTAVYLICWFYRLKHALFENWKLPETSCFIFWGTCKSDKEKLFIKMLSYLPIDVLIIAPNLNDIFQLKDSRLMTVIHLGSLNLSHFPKERRVVSMISDGLIAERDLNDIMSHPMNLGDIRARKIVFMPIHSTLEEISVFWNLELAQRPGYEITEREIKCPIIFSEISGVDYDDQDHYWLFVKQFINEKTFVIRNLPFTTHSRLSPIQLDADHFYKNGHILRDRIISHRFYQYNHLRNNIQDHLFEKIQELIELKLIRHSGDYRDERLIFSAALSFNKEILRLIQQLDFEHKAPSIIVINTGETTGTVYDAIQLVLLNMMGFDVLLFMPNGYQGIEQWFNYHLVDVHQVGTFHYDYQIPDFNEISERKSGWFSRFRRKS